MSETKAWREARRSTQRIVAEAARRAGVDFATVDITHPRFRDPA